MTSRKEVDRDKAGCNSITGITILIGMLEIEYESDDKRAGHYSAAHQGKAGDRSQF